MSLSESTSETESDTPLLTSLGQCQKAWKSAFNNQEVSLDTDIFKWLSEVFFFEFF